ncbi:MAG: SoxR reducing system RseC family protein [Pseudomonadota bacterium]
MSDLGAKDLGAKDLGAKDLGAQDLGANAAADARAEDDDRILRRRMRVVDRKDGWALLEGERETGCAACAAKTRCGAQGISSLLSAGRARLAAPESGRSPARIGDEVEVEMCAAAFLRASALAYLLPPASLAAVAAFAAASGLTDAATALLCAPALALSLIPLWLAERAGGLRRSLRVAPLAPALAAPSEHANRRAAADNSGDAHVRR